jgi:hypothetical protein
LTADDVKDTTYIPSTATPDTVIYYLRLQDTSTVNQCISEDYDSITVRIFANPTVTISSDNGDTLCYGQSAVLKAAPTTYTTYQWFQDADSIVGASDTSYTYINYVTVDTTFAFSVNVTEAHDSISCAARDTINIFSYRIIEAPTLVQSRDSICGPDSVTIQVALSANATSVKWYNGDKTEITAAKDSLTYTIYFQKTDSVFVSCVNDFGCETPDSNWLKVTVRVDTIPTVTITPTVDTASVCAESDLILHSTVDPIYAPLTYHWAADTGLVAPVDKDSVVFNHNVAGVYMTTLAVTDAHSCTGRDTIYVNVDSLPVLVLNENYEIKDDSWCEGDNGKITFTTPDYVYYSIDSMEHYRSTKVFDTLAVGRYLLMVENSKGCRSHATPDSVRDAIETISMTIVKDTNRHCQSPYGGMIAITSVTPAPSADHVYEYRLVKPSLDSTDYQMDTVFTALIDGFYKVIVRDTITGCTAVDTVTVPTDQKQPTATFNGPSLVCYLDTNTISLTSTEPNFKFKGWNYEGSADSLANLVKDSIRFSLYGFPAGKHIFVGNFEDSVTKCSNTTRDTVRVNSVNISLVTVPSTAVCAYDTIDVYSVYYPMEPTEDSIVDYHWYNGNYVNYKHPSRRDTVIVSPSVTSNFISLVATDNHGCTNTFGKTLSVWPLPDLTITSNFTYCENAITNINVTPTVATPPYVFNWDTAGHTVHNNAGYFDVLNMKLDSTDVNVNLTVTDANLCHTDSTILIHVIRKPGSPVFPTDTQFVCESAQVLVDTTVQNYPTLGNFTWKTTSPNVDKATGTYGAFYVNTEGTYSCYSDTSEVIVKVTGAPHFTVGIKYNSDVDTTWSKVRCYNPAAGDTLHIVVDPAPSTTLKYVYKLVTTLGEIDTTNMIILSDTMAGVYTYTINISDTSTHGTTICYWDTTVVYTF